MNEIPSATFNVQDRETLVRLDERYRMFHEDMNKMEAAQLKAIEELKKNFITRAEFQPIKNLVYGFAGLLLAGIVSWLFLSQGGLK